MSQSRQSHATATAPAGTFQEADTLVEAYAEDLMDEIFDDVDRILAGEETAIYADPIVQPQESASLLTSGTVTVPAMIVPVTAEQAVETSAQAPLTAKKSDATATDAQKKSPDKSTRKRRWGTFMLSVMGLSALAAVGVWWMRQQPTLQSATAPVVTAAPAISEEAAFGEYLKRSLRVISGERSAQTETQTPSAVATAPTQTANNQVPGQKSNNVIERVFVPLLQPGNSSRPSATSGPSNVVTLPSLPTPNSTNSEQSSAEPVPNIATGNTYELVGVLELGDRSAALFEINGSSQRVYIGETIGGSGWSIVSINNEEVVVRRNGEVRSIYIGQQF